MSVLNPDVSFASDGRPLTQMLVLDSDDDRARQVLFPIGRTVSGVFRTSTHWSPTHLAAARPESQRHFVLGVGDRDRPVDKTCHHFYATADQRSARLKLLELSRTDSTDGCRNSVMVIRTRNDMITGHSGIWYPAMSDFLRQFGEEQNDERGRELLTKR